MEQIYTIPIKEALDKSLVDSKCCCPFCTLYRDLEANELDIITGAAMMEPDIRIMTNRSGFCIDHYRKMYEKSKKLPIALMLQSHIEELQKDIRTGGLFSSVKSARAADKLSKVNDDCYLCSKLNTIFNNAMSNVVYLWQTDSDFKRKLLKQPCFCLPHYSMLLSIAKQTMKRSEFDSFYKALNTIEEKHLATLKHNIDDFIMLFDYRTENNSNNENAKTAIQDTILSLTSQNLTD